MDQLRKDEIYEILAQTYESYMTPEHAQSQMIALIEKIIREEVKFALDMQHM